MSFPRGFLSWLGGLGMAAATSLSAAEPSAPNIVLIYADDVGYGDLGCYGATRVRTPHLDRLAREGLRFTDAHAPAATCTPSRYAMLTGEYAWRRPGTGIARGDAAAIIQPGRVTLASLLQQGGYKTGVVGKWHLGLGSGPGRTDWNDVVKPGPLEIGFTDAFLIPATGDRVPCVYLENHRVVDLETSDPIRVSFEGPIGAEPTGLDHPELLRMLPSHGHNQTIVNGISRIGYMSGGQSARWRDEDMADTITRRAVQFLEAHRGERFFLYFSLHDIHVPRAPHARFVGKSEMGPRGDAMVQADWSTGEILEALDRLGLADDTLVIWTSDNGPVVDDGYQDEAVEKLGDHRPAGPFRGGKYSNFEGGTRVPMLVRWPGRVRPGVSDALMCQVDFPATLAALIGARADTPGAIPDSENHLDALLGRRPEGREELVEQAGALSLRFGQWKYIPPNQGAKINRNTNTELGNDPQPQLYDLATDPGERVNLAKQQPDRVKEMQVRLEKIRAR